MVEQRIAGAVTGTQVVGVITQKRFKLIFRDVERVNIVQMDAIGSQCAGFI